MKGFNSICFVLAAGAAALFLPACGGGDDNNNGDYYISPEQFKAGSKAFAVQTNPLVYFQASGGLGPGGGAPVRMTKDQLKWMFNDGSGREVGDDFVDEDSTGYILQGMLYTEGGQSMPCTVAYYVVGGSSGVGYLYVAGTTDITSGNDALERVLGHMMGCLTPADVKYAGLTADILGGISSSTSSTGSGTTTNYSSNLYNIPNVQRTLLVSLSGVAFQVEFKFSQGMATIYLRYASTMDTAEVGTETAKILNEKYGQVKATSEQIKEVFISVIDNATSDGKTIDVTSQTAVSNTIPFFATPAR